MECCEVKQVFRCFGPIPTTKARKRKVQESSIWPQHNTAGIGGCCSPCYASPVSCFELSWVKETQVQSNTSGSRKAKCYVRPEPKFGCAQTIEEQAVSDEGLITGSGLWSWIWKTCHCHTRHCFCSTCSRTESSSLFQELC